MLLHVREVLTREEVLHANKILAGAPWEDGRLTAGEQSARAKNNEQLREDCDETRAVQHHNCRQGRIERPAAGGNERLKPLH